MDKRKSDSSVPMAYRNGEHIIVTERLVRNLQKGVVVGNIYTIKGVTTLRNGKISILCESEGVGGTMYRINEERFVWRKITRSEIDAKKRRQKEELEKRMNECAERKFRDDCKRTTEKLISSFTEQEHIQISFVPMVVAEIAWIFAEKTRSWCAENRVSEVKALSREVQKIRKDYIDFIRLDLDSSHISHITNCANEIINDTQHFSIAFLSLINEFYRQYPDVSYVECRAYATISKMVISAYKRRIKRTNEIIRSRIGKDDSCENKIITYQLESCMDAYLSDFVLEKTNSMDLIERIFEKDMDETEFNVLDD